MKQRQIETETERNKDRWKQRKKETETERNRDREKKNRLKKRQIETEAD